MDSTINILSYNSTGCDSDKVNFINNLVSDKTCRFICFLYKNISRQQNL